MLPSSALLLLLGNSRILTSYNMKAGHIAGCDRLSIYCLLHSVSTQTLYPIWCGSDKEQPLSYIIRYHYQVAGMWDSFGEHIPGKNEIGEYEQYRSQGVKCAALDQCTDQHAAYDACIYSCTGAYDPGRSFRDYLCEYESQKSQRPDCNKHYIAFHLCRESLVSADLGQISLDEEAYEPDVGYGKGAHLHDETAFRSE